MFAPGGWPDDEHVFDGAASVVFHMDGSGGHPIIRGDHLEIIRKLIGKDVGFDCMHYAVEVPKGTPGDKFVDWLDGYYETGYSTNPHWVAEIKSLPEHPITRGVQPFSIRDEWYFNLCFRPEMKGITPIIVAKSDDESRKGTSSSPRGPYRHIVEAQGRDEMLAWGSSNVLTAAAPSASPEATSTKTGATPSSANSSSTPSPGPPSSTSPPRESTAASPTTT